MPAFFLLQRRALILSIFLDNFLAHILIVLRVYEIYLSKKEQQKIVISQTPETDQTVFLCKPIKNFTDLLPLFYMTVLCHGIPGLIEQCCVKLLRFPESRKESFMEGILKNQFNFFKHGVQHLKSFQNPNILVQFDVLCTLGTFSSSKSYWAYHACSVGRFSHYFM